MASCSHQILSLSLCTTFWCLSVGACHSLHITAPSSCCFTGQNRSESSEFTCWLAWQTHIFLDYWCEFEHQAQDIQFSWPGAGGECSRVHSIAHIEVHQSWLKKLSDEKYVGKCESRLLLETIVTDRNKAYHSQCAPLRTQLRTYYSHLSSLGVRVWYL